MTREEALVKVKGYLTDLIPSEDYDEVEEIMLALEQQPCGNTISRQAAIVALANNRCGNDEWDLAVTHDVETIKKIPYVEPERTSGKWIEGKKTPGYIKWNCSECGLLVRNPQKPWYEYCPKCGADMKDVPETNDKDTESEDKK